MFDAALRARLETPLDRVGRRLVQAGVTANALTAGGLLVGLGACVAIALDQWWIGLVLWLGNRAADGLDGPVARRLGPTELGGFFDIIADFAIYGGVLIAIGISQPDTRPACLVVLLTYYLSGSAFLAFSSLATRLQVEGDGRSLHFPAGIAEGSETIAAYIVILAWREQAELLLWVWAGLVAITLFQRLVMTSRLLR